MAVELSQRYPADISRSNNFILEKPSRKVVQYELEFDLQKAKELQGSKLISPEKYAEEEEKFDGFMRMQLLTALGERYNRGISEFSYQVREGKLVGEHSDEPFEDVLERGRAYRERYGNPVDCLREEAEVIGFRKMQEVMGSEETPEGTVMLSLSPPGAEGSIYKHNFYDGYRKNGDGSIQAIRFSSALTPEETIMKLWKIDPLVKTPSEITDVALLSNPILLTQQITLEKLHLSLHEDHEVLSEDDWQKIENLSDVLLTSYIATLKEELPNKQHLKEIYNALVNNADDIVDKLKQGGDKNVFGKDKFFSRHDFYALAYRPVRAVDTGCGFSAGMSLGEGGMNSWSISSSLSPYSVSEFAFFIGERKLKCKECPICKAKDVVATISGGKITCPECKASANYEC